MNDMELISWKQIHQRLQKIDKPGYRIYGVPKNGMILTGLLKKARVVYTPEEANVILDDLVDSGATREYYNKKYPTAGFVALWNKDGPDKDLGWLVFPWEVGIIDAKQFEGEQAVTRILQLIGEDPSREGLLETPKRVVKSWSELYSGYQKNPEDIFKVFEDGACSEMVILHDIEMYSTCEHHLLPFYGRAHIGYIPNGKVIGISKLARLLDIYSRRLQIQERLCRQITEALDSNLQPLGSICIIEAQHFCMTSRGVQKQNSKMVTSSLTGAFRTEPETRNEFLSICSIGGK